MDLDNLYVDKDIVEYTHERMYSYRKTTDLFIISKVIFLSGPISGHDNYEKEFSDLQKAVLNFYLDLYKNTGVDELPHMIMINPAEELKIRPKKIVEIMNKNIINGYYFTSSLLSLANTIIVNDTVEGLENSTGCKLELVQANMNKMKIIKASTFPPVDAY